MVYNLTGVRFSLGRLIFKYDKPSAIYGILSGVKRSSFNKRIVCPDGSKRAMGCCGNKTDTTNDIDMGDTDQKGGGKYGKE